MKVPDRIGYAAARLKTGHRFNRITVRDFLRLFGAERRGGIIVMEIKEILDSLELVTDPDFETAWIDAPIRLRLKEGTQVNLDECLGAGEQLDAPGGVEELAQTGQIEDQAIQEVESHLTVSGPEVAVPGLGSETIEDPTFRIGAMPAANKLIKAVCLDDSLGKAVALMIEFDFSQLPVMQGEREVKGMITWRSIATKFALGCASSQVRDLIEDSKVVDSNRTLFEAIPTIVDSGYVLVRDKRDKRITGIVTASDLSLEFQARTEPFLLLREIELHIRRILGKNVTEKDFELLASPEATKKSTPQSIADLTMGEYIRLIQHPSVWPKLNLKIDSGELTALLDEVRTIRNDVMHFDPDPMTTEELGALKRAIRLMQQLFDASPRT